MTDDELAQELAELLGDPDPAEPTTEAEIRIAIARGMRRLLHLHDRALQVGALAQAEMQRIKTWAEARIVPLGAAREAVEDQLATLHAMLLELDPKAKTVDTPAGVHGSSKPTEASIEWADEPMFVEWAREHRPDLVRETFAPDKPAAKKALRVADDEHVIDPATGDIIPGLAVRVPVRVFHPRPTSRDDQ